MDRPEDRGSLDTGAGASAGRSRIGVVQAVPRLLDHFGVDPAATLAEVGVEAPWFSDPDHLIGDALIGRLLSRCATRTGCEEFALRVGQGAGLSSLGLVGMLVRTCPNVGAALRTLHRSLELNDGGGIIALSEGGPIASLSYAIYEDGLEATEQIYQMASAVTCNVMRELCGPDWAPVAVTLPFSRPRDVRPWRAFFRAPLRFDSPRLALLFHRRWLDHPLRSADPVLHRVLSDRAAAALGASARDLPLQVRRVVRQLLLEGRGSIEAVARTFSMHRRTLDRHLEKRGGTFREVADGVRYEVSRQLLRDTRMSVSEVAAALHYGDASAFTHAFRRWSGATPREWRLSVRETADAPSRTPALGS